MNDLRHTLRVNATLQLQKEFENICFQYRLKLKKPIIMIEDLADSHGKWDGNRNIIFISENLVFKHEWHKVICILKHEMAHQIVEQIFLSKDIHGPDFIRATQWLGLDPFYSRATLSLQEDFPDIKDTKISLEEMKIFRKVEKLLSLAESSNEHEALLAMEKVREIYKKYNIERFSNNKSIHHVSLTINLKLKKIPGNVFLISDILQKHFFVSNIFSKLYEVLENCEHRCLVIMGERHNVLMAEHVYEFLLQKIESLWKSYQSKEKVSFKFKASYQKGLLAGFQTKLDSLKIEPFANSAINETAIVKKYEAKLFEYVKTQYPKTSSIHPSGLLYKDHYDKGTQEGRLIVLSKPISQRNVFSKKLLSSGTNRQT